jgi:undecaprenyl-diphosphatase
LHFIQNFDIGILLFIQDHLRCGLLDAVMIFFSSVGNWGLVWSVAAVVMLTMKKYRYAGVVLLLCLAVTWAAGDGVLKHLVGRPRPYVAMSGLNVPIPKLADFSFPSGHTATGFAASYAVTRLNGKRWAWAYAVAALIALSRLWLGMHYPTDVLGGAVLGTLVAAAVCALAQKFLKPALFGGTRKNR